MTNANGDNPMEDLQKEMQQLIEDFMTKTPGLARFRDWQWGSFSPRISLIERDEEYLVSAELPGMDESDVEISLKENLLTITGTKPGKLDEPGDNALYRERVFGRFTRRVPLPDNIEEDKIDASMSKGVLTVTLPKVQVAPGKKIHIKPE